jgi:hypothetical protein
MNYMKHLTNQTLLIAPKLKDWHGQDTWCVWTMIELLKDSQHQTRWSKKSWKTEIAMGRWFWSRYKNIRVQEMEEVAFDRDEWAKLLKKARAHQGLSSQWWWWLTTVVKIGTNC